MTEENSLKRQFDPLSSQFFITGSSSVIVYANTGTEKTTGYSLAESVGKKPGELWGGYMPSSYYQKMWYTIQHDKHHFLSEANNKTKQGESFQGNTYIVPILRSGNLSHFIALNPLIQNESEKKQFESDVDAIVALEENHGYEALKKIYAWLTRQSLEIDSKKNISLAEIFDESFIRPTEEVFKERALDKSLIFDAKEDSRNFNLLYLKYNKKIFSYFFSHLKDGALAEDFTQETFMNAFRHLESFTPSNASYQTYLFRIAHNILINHYRKVLPLSSEEIKDFAAKVPANSLEIISLKEGIKKLSPEEKEMLSLVYEQGYALKEIAEKKQKTENAVKLQISRIRKKLRELLDF